MPAESLDEQSTDTNNNDTNVLIPVSDQERLRWTDGNDGRILGLLYEIRLQAPLRQDGPVSGVLRARRGRHQHNNSNTVSIEHVLHHGRGCRPGAARLQQPVPGTSATSRSCSRRTAANGDTAFAFPTSLPPNSGFTINVLSAKKEDSKLLRSLCYVFGDAPDSDELIEAAAGSGLALLAALRARATAASTADRAIVSATFDRSRSDRMKGEITLTSLKSKVKAYKRARRDIAVRPACGKHAKIIGTPAAWPAFVGTRRKPRIPVANRGGRPNLHQRDGALLDRMLKNISRVFIRCTRHSVDCMPCCRRNDSLNHTRNRSRFPHTNKRRTP